MSDPTTPDGAAEAAQQRRKHVVAVNSEPALLNLVRELLQDERYNVTTSNFVPEIFAMIEALRPDLVLVDLAVGERAGWDLLAGLAEDAGTRGLPVLLTSTDPRLLERAVADPARYGAHRAVLKPYDVDDLVAAVRELIGSA